MPQSLAEIVRQRYPGKYDDVDDNDLEDAIVKKHPQYNDLVQPREAKPLLKVQGSKETDRLLSEVRGTLDVNPVWANDTKPKNDDEPHIDSDTDEDIHRESAIASRRPKTSTDVKTKTEEAPRSLSSRFADSVTSVLDKGSEFLDNHPKLKEMWDGPIRDPEHPMVGPGGLSNIPGVKAAGKWLADKIDPSDAREDRGIARPFLAGAVEGLTGNILAHPMEFSEIGPVKPTTLPKERGLPSGPSDYGPSSGRDTFDASFSARDIRSTEVPYRQERTVPPVRPPRNYTGPASPTKAPEAPVDLTTPVPKPPIAKPAASAVKPGYVDNAQTEFTNAKGEISLRTPTPDRISQLEDDGYTVARKLPSGAVIMSPPAKPTTVKEAKKAVNPFAKAPTEAAPIAEVPRPEPIQEPVTEPSPAQQFANQVEPNPNIFSGMPPAQQEEPQSPQPFISPDEKVFARNDVIPEPTPPEFHPVDAPVADEDPFVKAAQGVQEDDLYNLARERFRMGLDRPENEDISFDEPTPEQDRQNSALQEQDIFASAPKRQTDLAPANPDESVMDYHRRTGASIADSTRAVEGEDIEPSFARIPKEGPFKSTGNIAKFPSKRQLYDVAENIHHMLESDETGDRFNRDLEMFVKEASDMIRDETDPEIIKDNFHNMDQYLRSAKLHGNADHIEILGSLRDAALEVLKSNNGEPSFSRKPYQGHDEKIVQNISNETNPQIVKDTHIEWRDRGRFLESTGDLSGAARAREISKVAYQRLEDLLGNPDNEPKYSKDTKRNEGKIVDAITVNPEDEDFIRMETGNREDMLRNMVSQYAEQGARVANKELLQNALDATPTGGKITVSLNFKPNGKGPSISVEDSGPGLNLDMIKNEYVTLTGSGKRGKESTTGRKSIGEMGVGKATYLLGTDSFEVETVAKEDDGSIWKYSFNGTPEDMITGKIKVNKEKVSGFTSTGTKVTVYDSDVKNIRAAEDFLDHFAKFSNSPVEVDIASNQWLPGPPAVLKNIQPRDVLTGGKFVSSGSAPGGDFTITIPDSAVWHENQGSTTAIITARGMFQGAEGIHPRGYGRLPDRIVVNIEPTVPASDAKRYPLTSPTRERMKADFKQVITKEVDTNIMEAARQRAQDDLQAAYDALAPMRTIDPFNKADFVIHDAGGKYTLEEKTRVNRSPHLRKVAEIMKGMLNDLNDLFPNEQKGHTKKYGFLIDEEGRGGINIPDPSSPYNNRDLAILMNPFDAIVQAKGNPEIAAERMAHIILHEFNHNISRDEGPGFTWSLSQVDSKFGTKRRAKIAEAIQSAITGSDGNYAPELQDLLREYTEARGRTSTEIDLLSRSAESPLIEREGSEGVSYARKPDGKGTSGRKGKGNKRDVRGAVDALLQALQEAHGSREEQAEINRKTRSERFGAFSSVKQGGMAGAAKSLGKLRGQFDKVDVSGFEDSLDSDQVDSLFDAIKYAVITPAEKARGYTALFTLLNGGSVPPRSDLAVLDDVFGGGFGNKIIEMHSGIPIKLTKAANTMKAMRSSFDLSAPLRQGMGLWMRPEYYKALGKMFKFLVDPEAYSAAMQSISEDKDYLVARESGLFMAKPDDLTNGEEAFMNTYIPEIGKIPIAGPIIKGGVKASERAYTGFLNMLRFDVFKSMMKSLRDSGIEPYTVEHEIDEDTGEKMEAGITTSKELNDISKFINVTTGRGNLGRLEKMAPELGAVIWSPRLLASRLQMMNPKYYMGLSKVARIEAIKSLFAIATMGTIITGAMWLRGRKVSLNPTSADFLKARKGNNVIDSWTGYQQEIVAAARLITRTSNGRPKPQTETMEQFLLQKLSPIAALAYEIGSAQKYEKKNGNFTGNFTNKYGQRKNVSTEIVNTFVPMFLQDVVELAKSDLSFAEQVGLDGYSLLGGGVQNYPEANTKAKGTGMAIPRPSIR